MQRPGEADPGLLVAGPQLALGEHDHELAAVPQLAQHRQRAQDLPEDQLGGRPSIGRTACSHPLPPVRRCPPVRPSLRPDRGRRSLPECPADAMARAGACSRRGVRPAAGGGDLRRRPRGRAGPARAGDAPVLALAPSERAATGCPCPPSARGSALGPRDPARAAPAGRRPRRRRSVVAHGSRTLPAVRRGLAGTGVPFVYRSIGDPAAWSGAGLRRWRTAALLRRARLVAALWPGAADALTVAPRRARSGRVRIIPNGVPAARFPVPEHRRPGRGPGPVRPARGRPVVGYARLADRREGRRRRRRRDRPPAPDVGCWWPATDRSGTRSRPRPAPTRPAGCGSPASVAGPADGAGRRRRRGPAQPDRGHARRADRGRPHRPPGRRHRRRRRWREVVADGETGVLVAARRRGGAGRRPGAGARPTTVRWAGRPGTRCLDRFEIGAARARCGPRPLAEVGRTGEASAIDVTRRDERREGGRPTSVC